MKHGFHILILMMLMLMTSCISEPELSGEEYSSPEAVFMAKVVGDISAEYKRGELLVEFDDATTCRIAKDGVSFIFDELPADVKLLGVEPAIRHLPKNDRVAK